MNLKQNAWKITEMFIAHQRIKRHIQHLYFFSVKESFKPLKILPDTYNIWFHPLSFSFFYVYFHVNHEWSNGKRCSRIYAVDEKEFLDKMQEWGIELEVYNAREERFK